jgi:hypothetical protein
MNHVMHFFFFFAKQACMTTGIAAILFLKDDLLIGLWCYNLQDIQQKSTLVFADYYLYAEFRPRNQRLLRLIPLVPMVCRLP